MMYTTCVELFCVCVNCAMMQHPNSSSFSAELSQTHLTAKKYYNVQKKPKKKKDKHVNADNEDQTASTHTQQAVNPMKASKHMKGEFKMPSKHKRSRDDKTFVTSSGDVVTRKAGVGGEQVSVYDTNIVVRCTLLNMFDCTTHQPITTDMMFARLPTVFSAMSFPSASISLADPRVTVSVTVNGKICVTGGRKQEECITAIYLFRMHFARIFNAHKATITNIRAVNRSAHGSIECKNKHVNLDKLYAYLKREQEEKFLEHSHVKYDKHTFPGVLHWPRNELKKHYVAYYCSGQFLITGSFTADELRDLDTRVREVMNMFVENGAASEESVDELATQLAMHAYDEEDEDFQLQSTHDSQADVNGNMNDIDLSKCVFGSDDMNDEEFNAIWSELNL